MASTIKGLTIAIGGDTVQLTKALSDVNTKTKDLQSELKQVERLLKLDPTNTDLLKRRQDILAESIGNTKTKLDALKDAEKQVREEVAKGKASEDQYRAFQREIVTTEQKLKELESQAKKASGALTSDQAVGNLKKIGVAVGATAVATAAAFVAMGAAAVNNADELQKQSDVTGLSAERLQELTYAGNNLGVELDTITGAQAKLTKSMAGATDETKGTGLAFATLGIQVRDSGGNLRDAKDVMSEAFTALNGVGNETERDALAMQIFGKSAMELNPLIKAGGDELSRLSEEARNNGSVMSDEAVAGLDAFGDTIENLKTGVLGTFGEKFAEILPMIQGFLDNLKLMPEWIAQNSTLLTIIGIVIGTVVAAIIAYNVAAAWGAITTGVMTAAMTAFGTVLAFITSPITLAVLAIGALIAIGVLLYQNLDLVKEKASIFADAISEFFTVKIPNAMQNMADLAKRPLNALITLLNGGIDAINTLLDGLNRIKIDIPSWVPILGGKTFGFDVGTIPNIPMLANGGVLTSGSAIVGEAGAELLSIIGGRAVVRPLTSGSGSGGNTITQTVNIYGYTTEDGRRISKDLVRQMDIELGKRR